MAETPFGRYRLVELLGRGGMGDVYRAFDTETDRVVALKVLPPHLAQDGAYQERFRREARTAAGLGDPHVVPIHGYGEIDGRLYVDMRLVEGRDLGELIAAEGGRLSPARAVSLTEQVGSALDNAHQAGLIHRDVKPSNILVTVQDFAYLIDFGIARATGDTAMTSTGMTMGTLAYMAPERFNGLTDPRSDIYALTCVLFECLTGARAFSADSPEHQIASHLTGPAPRPSLQAPGVPPVFDEVVAKGLAKNPDERYQTGAELADAARRALAESVPPLATVPPTRPAPLTAPAAVTEAALPTTNVDRATQQMVLLADPRLGGRKRTALAVVAVALLLGYGILAFATKSMWWHGDPHQGVIVTLTPTAAATTNDLQRAATVIEHRLSTDGVRATAEVRDNALVVAADATDGAALRNAAITGQLFVRPVAQAIPVDKLREAQKKATETAPEAPAGTTPTPATAAPEQDLASRIKFEQQLRQNTNPQVLMMLAVPYMVERCGQDDVLAGNDDPNLPLVTCSKDGKVIYLLDKSIISGENIKDATSGFDQQNAQYVVNLTFADSAASTWADFTAANIGTQTAFTLDTQVISAPQISEPVPGGKTQITGDFNAATAKQLAQILQTGALPVQLTASPAVTGTVPGAPGSTVVRLMMIGIGAFVLLFAIAVFTYLGMSRLRPAPAAPVDVGPYV